MSTPNPQYETYATHPSADGPKALQVKFYRPEPVNTPEATPDLGPDATPVPTEQAETPTDTAEGTDSQDRLPLLVWFHAGDFHSGDIEANANETIAQHMLKHGYACAVVQYRLNAEAEDLSPAARDMLPLLMADADLRAADISLGFTGPAAIAAMEDGVTFLNWLEDNHEDLGLSGHYMIGGSTAGAITVLNMLNLAPQMGFTLPEIQTAIVISGAFAYPSFVQPQTTRTLAIMGENEPLLPVTSLRGYSYMAGEDCILLEHGAHQQDDPRISDNEAVRRAVRRFVQFDEGSALISTRVDRAEHKPKREHRICVYACARDEGPFLLEWIAHNRAIGVTDFVIFSNDCTDGTTQLLDALDKRDIIKHVPNPSMALGSEKHLDLAVQSAPYATAFLQSDYAIQMDLDEFIQINVADGTLNGLLAVMGHPDVVSLSEVFFGFGGVQTFENRLVTSQFRVSDGLVRDDYNKKRDVKSIMRVSPDIVTYSNHRPQIQPDSFETMDWVDGAGKPVPKSFVNNGKNGLDITGRYTLARINHYAVRSAESMLVKFERGTAFRPGRMSETYITQRNGRTIHNEEFLPFLPRLKGELGALLKDPTLLKLHKSSVTKHKAKIKALKIDPEYADVWTAILEELNQPVRSEVLQAAAE